MKKLELLLTSERTQEWVKDAAFAAIKEEPLVAINSLEFLTQAIREWVMERMKVEAECQPQQKCEL